MLTNLCDTSTSELPTHRTLMGTIKIPKKKKTATGVTSNEKETWGDNAAGEGAGTPSAQSNLHDNVSVAVPFIDRLTVVAVITDKALGNAVHDAVWLNHQAKDEFKSAKKPKGFQRAWRVSLPSLLNSKFWPHLSYAYRKDSDGECFATKLRLDFVPVDLGAQGMAELDAYLWSNIEGGWSYFLKHGHVTRLDVSVDFPALTMQDFHYLHPQGLTVKEWRQNGALETFQAGKANGNHTSVYDRGAKRKAQNSEKPGKVGVRIERRLKKVHVPLKDLASYKNPLAGFDLVERCPGPPPGEAKPYIWDLFLAAANQTSLMHALALLPKEKKAIYRQHMEQYVQPWWKPAESWAHWPTMLKELMLAP
jgi:hypothetical protein